VKRIAIVVLLLISALALASTVGATGQDVCPEGGDWSNHQDPPLEEVDDAIEYCVKGGSDNSQGCDGYLEKGDFEYVLSVVENEEACGLSHWGYKLGDPTATPTRPSATPDPSPTDTYTPSPTHDPDVTPTFTNTSTEGPSPTSTQTPNQLTETPSIEVTCPVPSGGQTCRKGSG
jgi:hypothetical protein